MVHIIKQDRNVDWIKMTMKELSTRQDEFRVFADLCSRDIPLSQILEKKAWKEWEKIQFDNVIKNISFHKKQILNFVEKASGLKFNNIDVQLNNSYRKTKGQIQIVASDTKTPLGFFGNYISDVYYGMYADGAGSAQWNPKTNEFKIWFNLTINYTHHSGGGNGSRDNYRWDVIYNITKDKFEIKRLMKNE